MLNAYEIADEVPDADKLLDQVHAAASMYSAAGLVATIAFINNTKATGELKELLKNEFSSHQELRAKVEISTHAMARFCANFEEILTSLKIALETKQTAPKQTHGETE